MFVESLLWCNRTHNLQTSVLTIKEAMAPFRRPKLEQSTHTTARSDTFSKKKKKEHEIESCQLLLVCSSRPIGGRIP